MDFLDKAFQKQKVNIIIEFSTFELVLAPIISLNRRFNFFRPNLPNRVFVV